MWCLHLLWRVYDTIPATRISNYYVSLYYHRNMDYRVHNVYIHKPLYTVLCFIFDCDNNCNNYKLKLNINETCTTSTMFLWDWIQNIRHIIRLIIVTTNRWWKVRFLLLQFDLLETVHTRRTCRYVHADK